MLSICEVLSWDWAWFPGPKKEWHDVPSTDGWRVARCMDTYSQMYAILHDGDDKELGKIGRVQFVYPYNGGERCDSKINQNAKNVPGMPEWYGKNRLCVTAVSIDKSKDFSTQQMIARVFLQVIKEFGNSRGCDHRICGEFVYHHPLLFYREGMVPGKGYEKTIKEYSDREDMSYCSSMTMYMTEECAARLDQQIKKPPIFPPEATKS
jgi:hypothetical protein